MGWDGIHLSLTPPTTRAPLAVLIRMRTFNSEQDEGDEGGAAEMNTMAKGLERWNDEYGSRQVTTWWQQK